MTLFEDVPLKTASFLVNEIKKMTGIAGFFFLLFKPMLILTLKKLFKKQMKAWIVSALEWLALQTDNDIDDAIVKRLIVLNANRNYLSILLSLEFWFINRSITYTNSKRFFSAFTPCV